MGLPYFFSWLITKYPNLLKTFEDFSTNKFDSINIDHLYFDLNGLLYLCKEELNLFKKEEDLINTNFNSNNFFLKNEKKKNNNEDDEKDEEIEKIEKFILKIFLYIEEIINRIKPKKTIFFAVDGVSPSIKILEQRQRRFKNLTKKKKRNLFEERKNKKLKKENDLINSLFDNNLNSNNNLNFGNENEIKKKFLNEFKKNENEIEIGGEKKMKIGNENDFKNIENENILNFTCGSKFMIYFNKFFNYFIKRKINDDDIWKNVSVYFSDSDIPGLIYLFIFNLF
jgi:5'-3' exoribonuclease 2